MSYKESASLRATEGSGDKLHLNNSIFMTAWWLYANTYKMCVLVYVDLYMHMQSVFVHVCLHVLEKNKCPRRL